MQPGPRKALNQRKGFAAMCRAVPDAPGAIDIGTGIEGTHRQATVPDVHDARRLFCAADDRVTLIA